MPEDRRRASERDASIHRSLYLTGDIPRPVEPKSSKGVLPTPDVSESGMPKIMASLKKFGIDPTKSPEESEAEGEK